MLKWWVSDVVISVASQQEGSEFESRSGPFWVEVACSPCISDVQKIVHFCRFDLKFDIDRTCGTQKNCDFAIRRFLFTLQRNFLLINERENC